jgi:cytochrome c oxidase cbb3-type subunit 2
MLALAMLVLVVVPYRELKAVTAPAGLKPYTLAELRGRATYVAMGCVYCHSQQPRDPSLAPDQQRGWGRASVAGDYVYDYPHLLGTARTGPDLFNIGARQPSIDWHLAHLYQPRSVSPGSVMPSYPFLFRVESRPKTGEKKVTLPPEYSPTGGEVVATQEALDLVAYLLALNHTYPLAVVSQGTSP